MLAIDCDLLWVVEMCEGDDWSHAVRQGSTWKVFYPQVSVIRKAVFGGGKLGSP
jgi:hypothetical protein